MSEKLLPCPFCGDGSKIMMWKDVHGGTHIRCRSGTDSGGRFYCATVSDDDESRCITRWNARPTPPQPAVEDSATQAAFKALNGAGDELARMAMTSGGTAGADPDLQASIDGWVKAKDATRQMRRIARFEPDGEGIPPQPAVGVEWNAAIEAAQAIADKEGNLLIFTGHRLAITTPTNRYTDAELHDQARTVAHKIRDNIRALSRAAPEAGESRDKFSRPWRIEQTGETFDVVDALDTELMTFHAPDLPFWKIVVEAVNSPSPPEQS